VDLGPQTLLPGGGVGEAVAIVGAPLTPVSAAGVARRTTRRVVAVSATSAAAASATAASAAPPPPAPTPSAAPPPPAQPPGAPPLGTVVTALPEGCQSSPQGGIEYYNCGGVYYRPAFQGNNLVYVVQAP
jgi:hypothetical protein